MHFQFLIWALLFAAALPAQTLTVYSQSNGLPISGAQVSSKSGPGLFTSNDGTVDISSLKKNDSLLILSAGFQAMIVARSEAERASWKIQLKSQQNFLDEVVVPVSRFQQTNLSQPLRVEKISSRTIAFQNPQTAADLLTNSGYVFVQKSQLGGGSPMLRGMATNRVLLVVDGVRMNNAMFRAGNLQTVISLDANAIEETEVLFGPGSVLYGSDAIGGVMNYKTLTPVLGDSSSTLRVHGNAMLRGSSANSEFTKHVDVTLSHRRWASTTSISHARYGDLRSGTKGGVNSFYRSSYVKTFEGRDSVLRNADSSLQVGSGYSQINVMQKIVFQATRYLSLDYGLHLSQTSAYNRYDRLYVTQKSGPYKNKLRWAEWYYGPQIWNMQRLGLTHKRKTAMYDQFQLIAAWQNFEESRYDREFMSADLHMQKEKLRALSFNLDLSKKLGERTQLSYGSELVHNKVNSTASTEQIFSGKIVPAVTRYPDGSNWTAAGLYAAIKHRVSNMFLVQAGLRYSYYRSEARFDTTYFPFPFTSSRLQNGTPSGSIGFIFTPLRSLQLYSNFATAFRAPNIDDLGKVFESTPGFLIVPNPNLKAEHGINMEAGFVKSFGNFLTIDGAAYYTIINDAMERRNFLFNGQSTILYQGKVSQVQAVQNISKTTVYGFQCGVEARYKGFSLRSNYSYQKGQEQMKDSMSVYPLRHAAPAFGSTHLSFQKKRIRIEFYAVYNGKMSFEELALTERINLSYARDFSVDPKGRAYVAAWYTLNLKLAVFIHPRFSITAGVENMTDQLYRPYSSGINAPGRNFILALRGNF